MKNSDQEKALLGKQIKKLREEKNLSQNQFAHKIGVYPQNIGKYEQGISVPSALLVKRMAEVFEVTVDTLLCGNGAASRVANLQHVELLRKIEKVDQMDEEDRKVIESVMDFALLKYSVKRLAS